MLKVQKDVATRVAEVTEAWEKMRPHKAFFGMTLEQFRQAVRPFTDARAEIDDLEKRLSHAVSKREAASNPALETVQGVVSGVRGDPEEGQNGELYAAMGYVPKNQRSTGLVRRRKEAVPATAGGDGSHVE